MRGTHELPPALRDRAGRLGLQLCAYLIDDDHLGHVVLHRLDHHRVLTLGLRHLHAPRPPYRRVGDVSVARDLVGRVHDHHPLVDLVREYAGALPQQGGLAHARRAHQQNALARLHEVLDDGDGAVHRPPDAAGEAHHLAPAVAYARYAVEGALDARAVVAAEFAYALG